MKKNILITGATDGVGRLTALELAESGHTVHVHGRNPQKIGKVLAELGPESRGFTADFSDLQQVRKMAVEVSESLESLDVLINNAGVFHSGARLNSEGTDLRIAVNYFAPVVLTHALIDLLVAGTEGRVINLSSAAQSPVSEALLRGEIEVSEQESYAQSKLALTMWSFKLAKEGVIPAVVAVNPGSLLNTRMVQEAYGTFWSEASKGSDILCALVEESSGERMNGQYFDNDKGDFGPAHPDAYNHEKLDRLWTLTHDLLG